MRALSNSRRGKQDFGWVGPRRTYRLAPYHVILNSFLIDDLDFNLLRFLLAYRLIKIDLRLYCPYSGMLNTENKIYILPSLTLSSFLTLLKLLVVKLQSLSLLRPENNINCSCDVLVVNCCCSSSIHDNDMHILLRMRFRYAKAEFIFPEDTYKTVNFYKNNNVSCKNTEF